MKVKVWRMVSLKEELKLLLLRELPGQKLLNLEGINMLLDR